GLDITLMDSPGLDGDKRATRATLEEASNADLLLWVSQANQPAKALDKSLFDEWDAYFKENLKRKKPPVVLVTTHNDLLKPKDSWQPPYDLTDMNNKKVQSIVEASSYTHDALGLPEDTPVLPIALKPGEAPYNIEALRELLLASSRDARAAQLNRERLDAADSVASVKKSMSQAAGLVTKGVKLIFR
ncbi:MAG: hypothetical protein WBN40_09760, partial [Pseudomonadales bacterium]